MGAPYIYIYIYIYDISRLRVNDVGLPEAKDPLVLYFGIRWGLLVSITLCLFTYGYNAV